MNQKIAIITTSTDVASENIENELKSKLNLEEKTYNGLNNPYYLNDNFLLYESNKKQLNLNNIDRVISKIFDVDLIVFPSRHSSEKRNQKTFSVHTPGNPGEEALYGGNKFSLSMSAPFAMKKALKSLERYSKELAPEFEVTLECTHHGPSEINIPCFFIEIGSSKKEWKNKDAGKVVAESIIDLKDLEREDSAAISLGGGHYSPRQTRLLFETETYLGHIIPDYQLENLDIIKKALEKTLNSKFIHLCREKTKKEEFREKINKIDYPSYREKHIRALDPIPFSLWKKIHEIEKDCTPFYFGKKQQEFSHEVIDKKFMDYVEKIDRKKLIESIKEHELVHYRYQNGEISNNLLFPVEGLQKNKISFINSCIDIIKQKRNAYVSKGEKVFLIEIEEKRFNPGKAKKLGLTEKQFGELTSGQEIEIAGNTITPAMVHNIIKKKFEVNYLPINKKEVIRI
ncbi:hypothetical protein C9439_01650 [archaeon SCG-AAA382B04]|nr:hypothetical protein C9439_01650 [archaeon SCG-AAA382B04]